MGPSFFLPLQMKPCTHKMGMEKMGVFITYLTYSCKIYILCVQAVFISTEISELNVFLFLVTVPHQITS